MSGAFPGGIEVVSSLFQKCCVTFGDGGAAGLRGGGNALPGSFLKAVEKCASSQIPLLV